ncbi:hypothetical protein AJ87_40195 [Rhizobium yanglingense]|nr:hypothetical protein AJ87_40195 [Rhizobium yanglingense]
MAVAQLAKPLPNLPDSRRNWQVQPRDLPAKLGYEPGLFAAANASDDWTTLASGPWSLPHPAKFLYFDQTNGMGLAVRLSDGSWLNSAYHKVMPSTLWNSQSLFSLGITAIVLSIIGVFTANRITRPLRGLASAAEALGRGEAVEKLPESGPDDIRQTAEAFNRCSRGCIVSLRIGCACLRRSAMTCVRRSHPCVCAPNSFPIPTYSNACWRRLTKSRR